MIASLFDRVLDASILFSFDRSGFERHRRGFDDSQLAVDLSEHVVLVTGANSGIGRAAAGALAARGAEVWLLCRSESRGRAAEEELRKESGNPRVRFAALDVSDLGAVRAFASAAPRRVDALVHNAGLLPSERMVTDDGLELTFATHVVGPLLLTEGLRAPLRETNGRVVFVSSGGMYTQKLSLEDVDWSRRAYDGVQAYAQTKRMQVVLAERLAERFADDPIAVHAMHPGWADTPGVRDSLPRFYRAMQGRLRSAEQGADTAVWLAAGQPPPPTGRLWFDRRAVSKHLLPWTREGISQRERFWRLACAAAGLSA